MKLIQLLIPVGVLWLTGCVSTQADKNVFYTPKGWEKPINTEARSGPSQVKPSFFPLHRNYGNSPHVDPSQQMEADPGFIPDFKGRRAKAVAHNPRFGNPAEFEQMEGQASWYGPGFHGKKTANGERYNQRAMTAAHKLLPMGTWVRVTNQQNGKSVVVRINDRGPYKKNRIIDLSETAAKRLGYADKGTAEVKLTVVRYPKNYDRSKGATPYKQVVVQVAVFSSQHNAVKYKQNLKSKHRRVPFMVDKNKGNFYVLAGPYGGRDEARSVSQMLKNDGLKNFVRSLRK